MIENHHTQKIYEQPPFDSTSAIIKLHVQPAYRRNGISSTVTENNPMLLPTTIVTDTNATSIARTTNTITTVTINTIINSSSMLMSSTHVVEDAPKHRQRLVL